jgi:hypothetical protein
MQAMIGLDMGTLLQSDYLCADTAKHISESMKMHLFQSIIELDLKIGLMINKSTTLSKKTVLVIYIKTVFPDSSEPSTFFCSLVEVNDMSASTILDSLLRCLQKHGFT